MENKPEDKKEIVTLDDLIMSELTKAYDGRFKDSLNLTEIEKKKIIEYTTKIKYGSFAWIPMVCSGKTGCVYRELCPIADKAPLGAPCPFEKFAAAEWYNDYVTSLDIDVSNKIERSQVMELVESDIINARANAVLGVEGFIMENPVGIDHDTGNTIYRKEEHMAMNIKTRVQSRRDRILKSFIATRETKMKALTGIKEDPTEYFARLRAAAFKTQTIHEGEIIVNDKSKKEVADNKELPGGTF